MSVSTLQVSKPRNAGNAVCAGDFTDPRFAVAADSLFLGLVSDLPACACSVAVPGLTRGTFEMYSEGE